MLQELCPGLGRIAFLGAANDPNTLTFVNETQAAADLVGVQLQPLLVTGPEECEAAFASMIEQGSQGLIVQPLFVGHHSKLAELALRHRLPMIADQAVFARASGLVMYGINRPMMFRRPAFYVDKILKGARPADLPIEQATTFEFVINLKTAKELGIDIPPMVLALADEIIE